MARSVMPARAAGAAAPIRREQKIGLAMSADEAYAPDRWRLSQSPMLSRSEAIRRLIERGITVHQDAPPSGQSVAPRAV